MTTQPTEGGAHPHTPGPIAGPEFATDSLIWMPLRTGVALVTSTVLTAISVAVVAASASVLGATASETWAAVTQLSLEVAADANWLLPTLFAAILAVLAILVGQNFVDLHEQDAAVNRRRLAAASWIIAGIAMATLMLILVSLAAPGSGSRHLWASTLVTTLIVSAAFWGGVIVLGSPQQQLSVLANTENDLEQRIEATPPQHESGSPWLRLSLSLGALVFCAALVAGGVIAVAGIFESTHSQWDLLDFLVICCICVAAAIGGTLQSALISQARDSSIRWWSELLATGLSTLVAVAPVGVIVASLPSSPSVRITVFGLLSAYTLPLLGAFVPRRMWRGRSLRGGLDGLRFRRFRHRQQRLCRERGRLELALRAQQLHRGWRTRRSA